MFALWRTCQHFATPDALPEASSNSLDTLLEAAADLPRVGQFDQFVARETVRQWASIGFISHGEVRHSTSSQLIKYDLCRLGDKPFSNAAYPQLTPEDFPQRTVDLDIERGGRGYSVST
jgi:hypothetical protein